MPATNWRPVPYTAPYPNYTTAAVPKARMSKGCRGLACRVWSVGIYIYVYIYIYFTLFTLFTLFGRRIRAVAAHWHLIKSTNTHGRCMYSSLLIIDPEQKSAEQRG